MSTSALFGAGKRLTSHITGAVSKMLAHYNSPVTNSNHHNHTNNHYTSPSRPAPGTQQPQQQQRNPRRLVLVEKIKGAATGLVDQAIARRNNPQQFPADSITPYIGVRARLSQVWINYYTIFIILVIIKLVLFRISLSSSLKTAEKYTMSSCRSSENIGSSAASVPHYMAVGANQLISRGLTQTRQGLIEMLFLSLTILEQLLLFVINMLVGTYVCLLTVAINTTANTAINATESVINFVDKSLTTVVDGIETGVSALEKAINTVSSAFNSIASAFTENDSKSIVSNVSLSVSSLKNLSIPSSINNKLEDLRSKIIDYDDVKNATSKVVSIPFNLIKTELNNTLMAKKIAFNVSAIHIPAQQKISFCSQGSGISDFYTQLQEGVDMLAKVFVILLAVTAIAVCIPIAYNEIKQWRWLKECAADAREIDQTRLESEHTAAAAAGVGTFSNPISNQRIDYIEVIQAASHKWVTWFQLLAARQFSELTKKTLAKWWIEYVLYPPALMVLALGLGGILVVIAQFIIFNQVKDSLPAFENGINQATVNTLGDVQEGIVLWANTTNVQIKSAQDDINDDLLGWVHSATGSVNDTLTVFSTTMNQELNRTFGQTPFYEGISGVIYCVIGSKIDAIQKGINWVHQNSQVSLPLVAGDYILPSALVDEYGVSNNQSTVATTPEASSVQRLTESAVSLMISAMRNLIEVYEKSLYLELKIAVTLFSIWLFVALTGFLYCWYTYRRVHSGTPQPPRDFGTGKSPVTHAKTKSYESDECWFSSDESDMKTPVTSHTRTASASAALGSLRSMLTRPFASNNNNNSRRKPTISVPQPVCVRDPPPPPPVYSHASPSAEWQRYRANDASAEAFNPPSILLRADTRATSMVTALEEKESNGIGTPRGRGKYYESPDYKDELLPATPHTPVQYRETAAHMPIVHTSPNRKSNYGLRGYTSDCRM
ncbi:hypothetical protein D0Z00_002924 [Geotrichum galactomycetum]|uniref:Uncharacterized protein n=1 Tax=Geotrichum galactomycetum TaxID=27317 RepID=A0ACB6V2S8_9ASCO|nr:hypothetical protein D0Z00_002924 [Geotrichum candidum]